MRHAAVTFADQVTDRVANGQSWDIIFCSDMLNLAEFRGLALQVIQKLPSIVYFHENQLTYPVRVESERDYQFAMTNMTTALAADAVWFNSAFHRDSFLDALAAFLARMPDYQPFDAVERIRKKAAVYPPGVRVSAKRGQRKAGPLRILWAARWEHDKNPDDFFAALKIIKQKGVDFRISVIGEQFRDQPQVFEWAKNDFADHIDRWGYQQSRNDYEKALTDTDVFVSTADHEFFGISAVEAALAGAYPVVPNRLAYPEIFGPAGNETGDDFFYDGTVTALANKLIPLSQNLQKGSFWNTDPGRLADYMNRFTWPSISNQLDAAIQRIASV